MNSPKIIRAVLVAIVLTLPIAPSLAQEVKLRQVSPGDKCPVCGMFVAKYPDFVAQIMFNDGSWVFFDGAKDMMKYYLNLSKYNPSKNTRDISSILVTDYYKMELINGLEAFYVIGSDVYGPMGKELIPIKEEAAAKEFMIDHKGKNILKFKDINPEIIKTLD